MFSITRSRAAVTRTARAVPGRPHNQNVSATYNGLVGTIAGPINSKLSFPVRVAREGLPPKINVKSSNLAAAEDAYSDEL